MAASAGVPRLRPPRWKATPSVTDLRVLGWVTVLCALALAAIGQSQGSRPLVALGAAAALVVAATLAPQFVLALYLVAGGIKEASWVPALPFDLTLLCALAVLVAIGVRGIDSGWGIPGLPSGTVAALLLAAVVWLGVFWTPAPEVGLDKAIRFQFLTLLAFFAPMVLIRSRQDLVRLAGPLVVLGLIVALTAVQGTQTAEPLVIAGGNEIELGLYTALGLLMVAGYLLWLRPAGPLWLLPAAVLLPTTIAAGSRGAVVGGAAALMFIFASRLLGGRSFGQKAIAAVVGVALVGLLLVLGPALAGDAASKYSTSISGANAEQVLGRRLYLYKEGLDLTVKYPLGVGSGGFQGITGYNYPHNIFLELGAEHGIAAIAIFLVLLLSAWRARAKAPGGRGSPEAVIAGALIVMFLIEAMLSFDLNGNRTLFFALGLAFAMPGMRGPR
jgi:O-antigen ligase